MITRSNRLTPKREEVPITKGQVIEEPCDGKLSSTVLNGRWGAVMPPSTPNPFGRTLEDFTLTGKLRRFHEDFDSSIRAILQDCLFRINDEDGVLTFQILCPNEAVQKRLYRKREKIRNTLQWIWKDLDYYALCVQKEGLQCQVLEMNSFRGYDI